MISAARSKFASTSPSWLAAWGRVIRINALRGRRA
jgi:hypothetical protein